MELPGEHPFKKDVKYPFDRFYRQVLPRLCFPIFGICLADILCVALSPHVAGNKLHVLIHARLCGVTRGRNPANDVKVWTYGHGQFELLDTVSKSDMPLGSDMWTPLRRTSDMCVIEFACHPKTLVSLGSQEVALGRVSTHHRQWRYTLGSNSGIESRQRWHAI